MYFQNRKIIFITYKSDTHFLPKIRQIFIIFKPLLIDRIIQSEPSIPIWVYTINQLKNLTLGDRFNKIFPQLSFSLELLKLGDNFNHPLPDKLYILKLGRTYNRYSTLILGIT